MLCLLLAAVGAPGRGAAPALAAPAVGSGFAGESQLPGFGKYRVIRIDSEGVFPRILRIERGATVVWFNATPRYSSVVFNKGEVLSRATRAPSLFYLAPDGTFVSAAFSSGGTASAAFVRAGTYYYFVTGVTAAEEGSFAKVVVK
jgi:hypothetical protein